MTTDDELASLDDEFDSLDDDLDSLREKSTRASTVYDDLEADETSGSSSGLRAFSPSQRLILALLLLLDIVALGFAILVVTGRFNL